MVWPWSDRFPSLKKNTTQFYAKWILLPLDRNFLAADGYLADTVKLSNTSMFFSITNYNLNLQANEAEEPPQNAAHGLS